MNWLIGAVVVIACIAAIIVFRGIVDAINELTVAVRQLRRDGKRGGDINGL